MEGAEIVASRITLPKDFPQELACVDGNCWIRAPSKNHMMDLRDALGHSGGLSVIKWLRVKMKFDFSAAAP